MALYKLSPIFPVATSQWVCYTFEWQYHDGGRLPDRWNIYSKNSRKEVLYGKYTKGKGIMYITLSELIQIGIFLVGFAALLKSKK